MLRITLKIVDNNILRYQITYQSERRESISSSSKVFYDDDYIRIVSVGCPEVNSDIIFLQGTSTSKDSQVLRFNNLEKCKQFFTALRICTDMLRVEL